MAGAILEAWEREPLSAPSLSRCSRIPECLQTEQFQGKCLEQPGFPVLCCYASGIQGQGCPVLYKRVN